MELDDSFSVSKDVVSREVSGEAVLLDLASGSYFGLNEVGTLVWEMLNSGACSLAQICDRVESEFDADRERIEADVIAVARQLCEKALIVKAA